MLTKEIVKYYADKGFSINDIIKAASKKKVTKGHLKLALEHCYNKIQRGKHVADADIFRYVLNVARGFKAEEKATPDETIVRNAQAEAHTMRERAVKLSVAAKNLKSQMLVMKAALDVVVKESETNDRRLKFKIWCLLAGFVLSSFATLFLTYVYVWRPF